MSDLHPPTPSPSTDSDPTIDPSHTRLTTLTPGAPAAYLSEQPGTRIGPYKLLQLVGEGGFGSVFMAEQERPVRRRVALKIIKLGMDTRQVVARFEQERQALAILDHPNIAKVFDAGATETGRPYFVMELCSGEPIDDYCNRLNLTIDDRLALFAQVCSAVQHAHTKGIIHRDLKPGNVLVTTHDDKPLAKVIDFGIAKATAASLTEKTFFTEHRQVIGTPEYMSPEQAEGSLDIDTRTDVYALGVMLYELLTESTPFSSRELRSAAFAEIQRIIREVEPPAPSTRLNQNSETLASVAARRRVEPKRLGAILRGELDWIVMKAIEKDRSRRYESASSLGADIQRYLNAEAVLAAPPSVGYRARKFIRKNRGAVVAGSLVAAALCLGVIGTSFGMYRASRAAHDAELKRQLAETNLGFARKANDILGSVFEGLDPEANYRTVADLRNALRDRLQNAANQLDGASVGDPFTVAAMQNKLGRSLQRLGEPQRAKALFTKALETFRTADDPASQDVLDALNNLAVCELDTGNPSAAIPPLEEALRGREAKLGLSDPTTIAGMRNLAGAYLFTGDTDRAEKLVKRALDAATTNLGATNIETLRCMSSLSHLYTMTHRAGEAIPLIQQTIKGQTEALGRDHPDTLVSLLGLANAYGESGKGPLALMTLESAHTRARGALGDDHLVSINIACQLATIYWGMHRLPESIQLFERAVVNQEKRLGRDNESTLTTIANLGISYKDAGRVADAIPLLEEALKGAEKHPSLNFVTQPLLEAYTATSDHAKAAALLESALAEARADLPADSPELATVLAQLGLARLSLHEWPQAERILRECLDIRARAAPDEWRTFNTRSMLGEALGGRGAFTEAEPLLIAGYEGLESHKSSIPPQAMNRLTESIRRLADFYDAWDRAEPGKTHGAKAAEWRAKLQESTPPATDK